MKGYFGASKSLLQVLRPAKTQDAPLRQAQQGIQKVLETMVR
jgi:hypothetical protein